MTADSADRRLAAIVSADVVGYSRLMADDEVATVRTLNEYRERMTELVREHRGRVVDFTGDKLLAEFPTALDAARCTLAIQAALDERNAELPLDRIMAFRTGIHVGDVRVEGERIYGDGVEIAARLESLATPGGICISGPVHDQIKTKLASRFDDLGEQEVKNIPEPIRVWRMQGSEPRVPARRAGRWRPPVALGALLVVLVAGGAAALRFFPAAERGAAPGARQAAPAGTASEPDAEPLLGALGVAPETATPAASRALAEVFAGRPESALRQAAQAARADLSAALPVFAMGLAHWELGELSAAASAFEAALDRDPKLDAARIALVATLAEQGEPELARIAAVRLRRDLPAFSAGRYAAGLPFTDPAERERLLAALRSAGLD